jgi:ATP-dependent RNA helicase DDX42
VNAEEVAGQLRCKEIEVLLLHGDMDQVERNRVITAFKKRETDILIATDVAGTSLIYFTSLKVILL